MKKTLAPLGVCRGGDGRAVVGLLVQQVTGGKDETGAVLQELTAHLCVQDKQVVVHRIGAIATIQVEVRIERKSPLPVVIADLQLRCVAENISRQKRRTTPKLAILPMLMKQARTILSLYFLMTLTQNLLAKTGSLPLRLIRKRL